MRVEWSKHGLYTSILLGLILGCWELFKRAVEFNDQSKQMGSLSRMDFVDRGRSLASWGIQAIGAC